MKEKSRCNFKEQCITGFKLAGLCFFSVAEKPPSMRSLPLRDPELLKRFPNVLIPGSVGEKKKGEGDNKEGSGL